MIGERQQDGKVHRKGGENREIPSLDKSRFELGEHTPPNSLARIFALDATRVELVSTRPACVFITPESLWRALARAAPASYNAWPDGEAWNRLRARSIRTLRHGAAFAYCRSTTRCEKLG